MVHIFKLKTLLLWHRRFGVVSALFVLLLCVSGILLNHAHDLGLDSRQIQHPQLLKLYNIQPPELISTQSGSAESPLIASQLNEQIFINGAYLHSCDSDLVGALEDDVYLFVACKAKIAVFTHDGVLIDILDSMSGVPASVEQLGLCDQNVCVKEGQNYRVFDPATFSFNLAEPKNNRWVARAQIDPREEQRLLRNYTGATVSVMRLVQDVHAGRFLGTLGPLIMDVVALLFIILAVTGLWVWSRKIR